MSWSDRPTNRPPSVTLGKLYGLAKTWGPALISVATAALSAYGFVEAELQRRIDLRVHEHDEDRTGTAHPAIRKRLETLEDRSSVVAQNAEKAEQLYKALYEMYWFRVGEKAIELEPDRRLHARARAHAQAAFTEFVRQGESLEDAYRRSLSQAAGLP